jgi:hypothetical protein
MYISRPELEKKFSRAIKGTQHVIVFGDSGSGKTWLYKKYFADNNIKYRIVDLSIAITEGLSSALSKALTLDQWRAARKTEGASLEANFIVARPGESRQVEFFAETPDYLELLLADLRSDRQIANFVVFDNFEQVSNNTDIIRQITSLIIRLDNDRFAKFNVRFLFVGVISDMKELIARYDNAGTVSNRLTEIPEVERLTPKESDGLVLRGLEEKLKIKIEQGPDVLERIRFLTDRNAQQVHELCYQLACEAEESDWCINSKTLEAAQKDWIDTSLSQHIAQIESRMNKRDTKIQRRNQVLYCLGASDSSTFKSSQIDQMIRRIFPESVSVDQLGVDQILTGLSEGRNSILVRNPNETSYRFSHPKLRLAIRVRLEDLGPKRTPAIDELLREILKKIDLSNEFFDPKLRKNSQKIYRKL